MIKDLYSYFWFIPTQIWLYLPGDDCHFFDIFLCVIATLARKRKQITKNVTALTSVFFLTGEILSKGEIQLKIKNNVILEVFSPQK